MPVVRIFVDEPCWDKVKQNVPTLGNDIHQLLIEGMKAHPESCQILFTQSLMPHQVPSVYVDFQYRASEARTKEVVQPVADKIAGMIAACAGVSCRTRAFAIDVETLIAAEGKAIHT